MDSGDHDDPMRRFIAAGTIISSREGLVFRVLTDTTAHGCPLVEILEPGDTNYRTGDRTMRTLNQHLPHSATEVVPDPVIGCVTDY